MTVAMDKSKPSTDKTCASAAQNVDAEVSTIYDPRRNCSPAPSFMSLFNVAGSEGLDQKKKTIVEKFKKILNVKFKHCEQESATHHRIKLICCSVLLTCTTLMMLTIFVYFLSTIQKPERREIIVDGEFQILNREFSYDMLDKHSSAFQELAFNLSNELNRLFGRSDVGEYYERSEVLEVSPNMTVKCLSIFRSSDVVNVGRIGLAFLRSLRLQHGHTWLGVHTINVQSIGFQIRGEEGVWGDWSDWTGCTSAKDYVATRTRKCLAKDTFQATDVGRCLLIPGNKGDLDIMPCRKLLLSKQEDAKRIERITMDSTTDLKAENITRIKEEE